MADGSDGPILIESATEREAKERANEQRQDRRQRKLQLCFNFFLLLATVVTAGIVLYQNRILSLTLSEMVKQTVQIRRSADASINAADAAKSAAQSAENQLPIQLGQLDTTHQQIRDASEASRQQTKLALDQITQARDALREDQRAWLAFTGYSLFARAPKTNEWQQREPNVGDQFQVRFELRNYGRTPAWNMWSTERLNFGPVVPPPPKWSGILPTDARPTVVVPGDDGRFNETLPYTIEPGLEPLYRSEVNRLFVWSRMYYCDASGRRHWTDVCISHLYKHPTFGVCGGGFNRDGGEQDHPDCAEQPKKP